MNASMQSSSVFSLGMMRTSYTAPVGSACCRRVFGRGVAIWTTKWRDSFRKVADKMPGLVAAAVGIRMDFRNCPGGPMELETMHPMKKLILSILLGALVPGSLFAVDVPTIEVEQTSKTQMWVRSSPGATNLIGIVALQASTNLVDWSTIYSKKFVPRLDWGTAVSRGTNYFYRVKWELPPDFADYPGTNVTIQAGTPFRLETVLSGDGPFKVSWQRLDPELHVVGSAAVLSMGTAKTNMSGQYRANAGNDSGWREGGVITVTVTP